MQRATTTVSILRGTTTNSYGDAVDDDTVSSSGIPASIREVTLPGGGRKATSSVDGRPQQTLIYSCRVPYGTDVEISDRVKDESTGEIYVVAALGRSGSSTRTNDLRLNLRRAS